MTAVQITLIVVVLLAAMNVIFVIRERRRGLKIKAADAETERRWWQAIR